MQGISQPLEGEPSIAPVKAWLTACLICFLLLVFSSSPLNAQDVRHQPGLDEKIGRYLDKTRGTWSDWNVPYEDGKILHDLVVKQKFKNILEIGTSTGLSTIWLARAAAKTGGKVTTIEIDRERHEAAIRNFREAGVASLIDARLGDAHDLVRTLKGPFDFVFCDADKEWYLQYFLDLEAKMAPGACYTAHNVLRSGGPEVARFIQYVKGNREFRTVIERGSGEGISVSCRIAK